VLRVTERMEKAVNVYPGARLSRVVGRVLEQSRGR
jgi:hypothetical protein